MNTTAGRWWDRRGEHAVLITPAAGQVRLRAFSRVLGSLRSITCNAYRNTTDIILEWLIAVVRGYFQDHAVPGNEQRMKAFRREVLRLWLRQLRRRSQLNRPIAPFRYKSIKMREIGRFKMSLTGPFF